MRARERGTSVRPGALAAPGQGPVSTMRELTQLMIWHTLSAQMSPSQQSSLVTHDSS